LGTLDEAEERVPAKWVFEPRQLRVNFGTEER